MSNRSARAQWTNAVVFGVVAGLLFYSRSGEGLTSLIMPVLFVCIAVASSPLLKRTSVSHDEALAASNGVVIYHRPGCTFCIRMKALLGPLGAKATWVDIWDDDDAAEYVRSVNNGNETVPTVVISGKAHTNPAPSFVKDALSV